MDSETAHLHAEAVREQHELERQAAERARIAAEESRMSAESGRRVVAGEVNETIATLKTLVSRMEAVEALRRYARKDPP